MFAELLCWFDTCIWSMLGIWGWLGFSIAGDLGLETCCGMSRYRVLGLGFGFIRFAVGLSLDLFGYAGVSGLS